MKHLTNQGKSKSEYESLKINIVKSKLLALASFEKASTPDFKVTFVGKCKPKIIKSMKNLDLSTDEE